MNGVVRNSHAVSPCEPSRNGNAFPRTAKLLKHALFDQVYQRGQRHFSPIMTVFFLRRGMQGDSSDQDRVPTSPRVGLTVGRVLGNSVTRNRIRRRMREAVRLNLCLLPADVDVVINPKKNVAEVEFPKVVSEVEKAFRKIAGR